MSDLISRQAAIDTEGLDEEIRCEICRNPMHTSRGCDGNCTYDEKLYEKIMQILDRRIKQLPSAQPSAHQERMRGRWVPVTNGRGGYECDQCHNYAPSYQDGVEWLSDFCPNCGAKMDEEIEGRKK